MKSNMVALERAGATYAQPNIVAEMAAANGHGTPTDTDRRDTHDYAVGLRFVWHSNYPKYIVELSNNQLDHENKYPQEPMKCCISVVQSPLALNTKLAWQYQRWSAAGSWNRRPHESASGVLWLS